MKYRDRNSTHKFTSYQDLVDTVVNVERILKLHKVEQGSLKKKNDLQNNRFPSKKPDYGGSSDNRNQWQNTRPLEHTGDLLIKDVERQVTRQMNVGRVQGCATNVAVTNIW